MDARHWPALALEAYIAQWGGEPLRVPIIPTVQWTSEIEMGQDFKTSEKDRDEHFSSFSYLGMQYPAP